MQIRSMHFEERASHALADAALRDSLVRLPFAERRAADGHDLGDAEAAADLDQLAARDDRFFYRRERA